jgi:threonyl-tRNA synthetase
VASAFDDYARTVSGELTARDVRTKLDVSDERMNAKIRNAQNQKIPYMLIVGERERDEQAVSLRTRTGERRNGMPRTDFLEFVRTKIEGKEVE